MNNMTNMYYMSEYEYLKLLKNIDENLEKSK